MLSNIAPLRYVTFVSLKKLLWTPPPQQGKVTVMLFFYNAGYCDDLVTSSFYQAHSAAIKGTAAGRSYHSRGLVKLSTLLPCHVERHRFKPRLTHNLLSVPFT